MDRIQITSTVVTCFEADIASIKQAIDDQLKVWHKEIDRFEITRQKLSPDQLRSIPTPPGGRHPMELFLFVPSIERDNAVFVTNYVDGWSSLSYAITRRVSCKCFLFKLSPPDAEYPMSALTVLEGGKRTRLVRAMLDGDRWEFWQEGPPLDVEDLERYQRRRIRDRVTTEYIFELAARLGWPIDTPEFWTPKDHVLHYQEHRPAHLLKPG